MIRIKELSKSYGAIQVLNNIKLTFKKGKVHGIIGENGSGKITLFKCIAGIETYKGLIEADADELKNHLGLLPTEPYFFDKMTGKEYIRFLGNARNKDLVNIEKQNIFDLPLNQYASTYSTGMKKKLALTAILLQNNQYFILDEPFNGIDIRSNVLITEIIHKLKSLGKIVIISSHIFSTLADTCDEIKVLREGVIKRSAHKQEFTELERETKDFTMGMRIDRLNLT